MWEYTDTVKEHFFNPRNVGQIENADGVGEVGSAETGDALKLMFKLDGNGRIKDARFKAYGGAGTIAASSVLTSLIKGKTLDEAAKITNKNITDYLGGLPERKMYCPVMSREGLEAAIESYRNGDTRKAGSDGRIVCNCFSVTEKVIEKVIRENNLTTVEQVTNYCKASGGCDRDGACKGEIEKIIERIQDEKAKNMRTSNQTKFAR